MATSHLKRAVEHVRKAALLQDGAALTDGQLLSCFVERRDESAFAVLVRRHAPMVWRVCRRLLANHHDAEDAFQATFLVLVRKASAVVPREMVANWLHGVAQQTAWKARTMTARRKAREKQIPDMPEPAVTDQQLWRDLQPVLDRELSRLPDKYRVAIILCDLEGKTRRQAARQLGVPDGTLAARLARGRTMLAKRLARQGLTASSGVLAALLSPNTVPACVPSAMISFTIKAATGLAAGRALGAGAVPATVAALTQGVLTSMFIARLKMATVLLVAAGVLTVSVGSFGVPTAAAPAAAGEDNKELLRTTPVRPLAASVQVHIAGPAGMKVHLLSPSSQQGTRMPQIEAPGRLNLAQGKCSRLKLADIPNRPGLERFPTVEILQADAATEPFVSSSAVPIEFTDDDFDHVNEGNVITKVVYLTAAAKGAKVRHGQPITLASYDYPERDVIEEATRRGTVLAIVRMGNIEFQDGEAERSPVQGRVWPGSVGKTVGITTGNDGLLGRVERQHKAKGKADERDVLLQQLDRLMVELDKARSENGTLKKQLKDRARAKDDILLNQVEHFMLEAAKAEGKNETLKKQLDKARLEIRSLQTSLAERALELRRLKKGKKQSD
jgi:RNA polymerase sigma factor (sigma-70 family)